MNKTIVMDAALFELSNKGLKTATTRLGIKNHEIGPAYIKSNIGAEKCIGVEIISITYKRAYSLTDEDARKEGYCSREVFLEVLKVFYPSMNLYDIVTVIEYEKKDF